MSLDDKKKAFLAASLQIQREAEEKATLIAEDVHPGDGDMVFDDERIEVEPIL